MHGAAAHRMGHAHHEEGGGTHGSVGMAPGGPASGGEGRLSSDGGAGKSLATEACADDLQVENVEEISYEARCSKVLRLRESSRSTSARLQRGRVLFQLGRVTSDCCSVAHLPQDALDAVGTGRFQWQMLLIMGLGNAADAVRPPRWPHLL